MCEHRNDAEDCILRASDSSDRLVCVQHVPAPIPRQRTDDLDLLVAVMQRVTT